MKLGEPGDVAIGGGVEDRGAGEAIGAVGAEVDRAGIERTHADAGAGEAAIVAEARLHIGAGGDGAPEDRVRPRGEHGGVGRHVALGRGLAGYVHSLDMRVDDRGARFHRGERLGGEFCRGDRGVGIAGLGGCAVQRGFDDEGLHVRTPRTGEALLPGRCAGSRGVASAVAGTMSGSVRGRMDPGSRPG